MLTLLTSTILWIFPENKTENEKLARGHTKCIQYVNGGGGVTLEVLLVPQERALTPGLWYQDKKH